MQSNQTFRNKLYYLLTTMLESPSLLHLPTEVLLKIFKFLRFCDIHSVILTCRTFKDIISHDNGIWKCLSNDIFLIHNSSDNSKPNILSNYHKNRVSRNWSKGIYKNRLVLEHYTNYMPWIQYFDSEYLITTVGSEILCFPTERNGMPDCRTLQWRTTVPTIKRYDVRTNDVSRFKIRNSFLVCGNRDGCASVYSVNSVRQKPRLLRHIRDCHENGEEEVTDVEMLTNSHMSCVVTCCDQSSQLCFFNLDTNGNHFETLPDIRGMKCLATNKAQDKLAIGANGSNTPILFDVHSSQLLLKPDEVNRKRTVRDIQWLNENTFTFVTHSGTLQSIDARTNEVTYQAEDPFQSTLYCLKTDGERAIVVGSSEYSRCVLFDTRNSRRHVQMYFTQKKSSPIYSLDFDATKLVAAADRSIAVLNYYINSTKTRAKDYSQVFEVVR